MTEFKLGFYEKNLYCPPTEIKILIIAGTKLVDYINLILIINYMFKKKTHN